MSPIEKHIGSFLNGNIRYAKEKLKRRSHRELRQAYEDYCGGHARTATAFADFIKGGCSFQEYCDTK